MWIALIQPYTYSGPSSLDMRATPMPMYCQVGQVILFLDTVLHQGKAISEEDWPSNADELVLFHAGICVGANTKVVNYVWIPEVYNLSVSM